MLVDNCVLVVKDMDNSWGVGVGILSVEYVILCVYLESNFFGIGIIVSVVSGRILYIFALSGRSVCVDIVCLLVLICVIMFY